MMIRDLDFQGSRWRFCTVVWNVLIYCTYYILKIRKAEEERVADMWCTFGD